MVAISAYQSASGSALIRMMIRNSLVPL